MATCKQCVYVISLHSISSRKHYYMTVHGILFFIFRAKMIDLAAEISRLQKEVDSFNQENATFLTYEKQ